MFKGFDDISSIVNYTGVFRDSGMHDIERRLMILEEENKQLMLVIIMMPLKINLFY